MHASPSLALLSFSLFAAACSSSSSHATDASTEDSSRESADASDASSDAGGTDGPVESDGPAQSDGPEQSDGSDGSPGPCDGGGATCPAPSSVVKGATCCSPGLSCTGTIDNNCGVPVGSTFACMCLVGTWECEGPDASGAICDAGHD